ncbi:MAG: beta-ketoacyl synthase N-terminal-like domain-containing protein, partial [Rhizobacter sp.]
DGREQPRTAGISSFGAGGSNAHLIVQEHVDRREHTTHEGPALIVLSARTEERLRVQVQRLSDALSKNAETQAHDLHDIAYTLQVGREAMEVRLACVVHSREELQQRLQAYLAGRSEADLYSAEVKRHKEALAVFAGEEELQRAVQAWISQGRLAKLAELWVKGLVIDWGLLHANSRPRRVSLPTYAFAQERYWVPALPEAPAQGQAQLHPLVHANTSDLQEQRYSSRFSGEEFFLREHVVQGRKVLPGVAQLEMAREAVARATGSTTVRLEGITWVQPVVVGDTPLTVHVAIEAQGNDRIAFELYSGDAENTTVYSQGCAVLQSPGDAPQQDAPPTGDALDVQTLYERLEQLGLHYGPAMRALSLLHRDGDRLVAELSLPRTLLADHAAYGLHPSLLDSALHSGIGLMDLHDGQTPLPFALDALTLHAPIPPRARVAVQRSVGAHVPTIHKLDIEIADLDGRVCVSLTGLSSRMSGEPAAQARGKTQERMQPPVKVDVVAEADELALRLGSALMHTVSQQLQIATRDLDSDSEFNDLGFDSVSLTALGNRLNDHYGLALSPTVFFEYPTLAKLCGHLVREHGSLLAAHFAVPARAMTQPPALTAPVSTPARRRRARYAAPTSAPPDDEPIAIIGLSGSFPQARDVQAYWENLAGGRDCIEDIPDTRWDWSRLYGDPKTEANKTNARRAGLMHGMSEFDPLFFGISPREAQGMDPQQRLLMTHVWSVLEDAGYAAHSLAGSDTALFVGTANSGYGYLLGHAVEGSTAIGTVPSIGPNRMSYLLDLHGPSEPVETACSSSLVAIHKAVQALRSGQSAMAIAGGINTLVSPDLQISFDKAGMLCEDGRCKTFAKDANGYVRGEGVGMLLLKRLSQAEADGDHIHGLVRATAQNHGGRANSLTAPNPRAQAEVVKAALREAGIDPATVGYIEAHGTGTPLGDPIEIQGLKSAFKELGEGVGLPEGYCGVGSVKTNIGHLELAAGVAGVIKVLLQMKHRTLVKSLYSEELNPYIDLKGSPFYIVQDKRPWEAISDAQGNPLPRRAGVSSFGFGGVNAHVVLEEYVPKPAAQPTQQGPVVVVLSARSEERLRAQVQQLLEALRTNEHGLHDIAYTLQVGREPMDARLACVVDNRETLQQRLQDYLEGRTEDQLHTGEVKRRTALAPDDDLGPAIDAWIAKGKLDKLAELWVQGLVVDWRRLHTARRTRRVSLPTYAFARENYWIGPQLVAAVPEERAIEPERHKVQQTVLLTPAWQPSPIEPAAPAWQAQHVILCGLGESLTLPGAQVHHLLNEGEPAARYEAQALQLLAHLQGLLQERPSAPVLVQLAVPHGDPAVALSGLLRSASRENPKLHTQLLQFDTDASLAQHLQANAAAASQEPSVRYVNGERQVQRLAPLEPSHTANPTPLAKPGGLYLITGGAGGLGLLVAQTIARTPDTTLILTGRSELSEAMQARLRQLPARVE